MISSQRIREKRRIKTSFLGLSLFPSLVEEGVEAYYRIEKLLKAALYLRTFVFKYITWFITMRDHGRCILFYTNRS